MVLPFYRDYEETPSSTRFQSGDTYARLQPKLIHERDGQVRWVFSKVLRGESKVVFYKDGFFFSNQNN